MPLQDREGLGLTTDDINAHEALWQEFQKDLVNWSRNGELLVARDSTHYVYFDEPDLVLKALKSLLR